MTGPLPTPIIIDYLDTAGVHQTLTTDDSQVVFSINGVLLYVNPKYYFQPWSRVLRITSDKPIQTGA